MEAYIIKFNANHEFYCPFEEPLHVWEVKNEMSKQLEVPTKDMKLIYNGKILADQVSLDTIGVHHGSILHLYVRDYDNIFLQSPKRMVNEVLSIFMNINIIPDDAFLDAIQTVQKIMKSPIVQAFVKVLPELNEIFAEINDYIAQIEMPYDESVIGTISRIHDNSFYNSHFFEGETGHFVKLESEEVSIYETKCQFLLEPQEELLVSDSSVSFDEVPTNLDYTPCINSNPLPMPDNTFRFEAAL